MKIIDISWPISENMTGYKDRQIVKFEQRKDFAKDKVRETTITIDAHSGTHVDAPSHFMEDGKTIDNVSLNSLIGACAVLDCTAVPDKITREILMRYDAKIKEGDIILLKTANSKLPATALFNPNFVYLEASGAHYLQEKRIKAVGIDYLGIERGQPAHDTHLAFMSNNIVIIEGLRLQQVQAGNYLFCCLPLKVVGIEACPARAVLIEGDGVDYLFYT